MRKLLLLSVICFLLTIESSMAQSTTSVPQQAQPASNFSFHHDSFPSQDSLNLISNNENTFGLLDTLANDSLLHKIFNPYSEIRFVYYDHFHAKLRRSLPTIKEITERITTHQAWKFWIILTILLYIAIVRIINPNNFRVFFLSVFNLKLSEKIWEDQRSFFGFVILQLFAIYIFIAALFISNWMELKRIILADNYVQQFFFIILILFVVYLLKFFLHILFGYLLQMKNLGIGLVSNTISVNNFIALVVLPLLIFLIYNNDPLIKVILSQTIIAVFFLSVLYRVVRITLLSDSFFSFPRIYLFIYLCALEVLPWFVIIKYLNKFQI